MPSQENRSCFLLFRTIHDVLKAEKALKKEGVRHELVPVPRNLSTDCGMCIATEGDFDVAAHPSVVVGLDKCYLFDGNAYILLKE